MPVSILCVLSVMVALFCPFGVYAGETSGPPLSSGCEIDYPPFCIVHEDGRADGFSVELLRAALAKMGREVTFRTGPWAEVRGWLERGEVDCLPLVGRTPEREALFDFTVPYLTMHGAIVVRRDTEDVHTLADLRGQRVGVMKGDNAEEFLRRRDRGLEIIATPTFSDAFRALAEGRCDAVVVQRLVALRLLEKTGLSDRLRIIDRPIKEFSQAWCFAVKEGDRKTLALLNEGLALVVADGTHRRLHAKWFAHLELPSDRPIVIGGDHNYPPFEFLDKNGRPTGFTVELTRAIAREMNLNVRFRLGPWEEIMRGLDNGDIDAVQGMFYTPKRDRRLDFSPHYLASHYVALTRADAGPPPETLEGLEGHRVAVQAGDALLKTLAKRGINTDIVTVESQEEVLRAVRDGRADLGVGVRMSALYFIEKNGWSNLAVGRDTLFTGQCCYAVPSGSEALLAEFVEGMRLLKDSGEYHRLYEKWMGVYEEHLHWGEVLKVAGMVAGPLLLVALLALLWLWSLRRQVAARTRELRANEQQLRQSREKFRRIFNNANDAMYLHALTEDGMPGAFLEVNDTACEMLGYSRDEFLQMTPQDIEAEERKDNVPNIVSELEAEKYVTFETKQMAKDGTMVPVEIGSHLFEMGGERRILSVARDITARKREEQEIRRLNSLLRAIRNVNEIIVEEDDSEALLQRSCQSLLETRNYSYVWAATWDREGELNLVGRAGGVGRRFDEFLSRAKSGWKPACFRRALSESETVFVLDLARDCGDCPLREAHGEGKSLKCGFGDGTGMGGLLSFRLAEGHKIDDDEKSLIAEVAGDLGQGLRRMEAE
ncbi:MAG: transporter substrate-binding domain-containing protein, partial [Planctomycetes bacterium]|nr:transporter substrate-binding domain-containing protein [Planctomycetota bacterium]